MSSKTKTTATKEEVKPAPVPKLRFPEFRGAEAWKPVTLQEASTPVTERVGERKLTPVSISAGIGFVPQAEKFGRDISGNQYQLYTLVKDGDFVFNKGNSLKFPQGCVYLLQGWGQVAAPNVFICFRLKDGYSNGFFQNCFEQNQHGGQLKRHITSGARSNGLLNISKETFFGVEIPTPSTDEQQKIAECLSSVDELMAAQARKVDALKTHKKGLMQQLFPREGDDCMDAGGRATQDAKAGTQPRLRFPEFQDEWTARSLEELSESIASGKDKAATDGAFDLYGSTGIIGKTNNCGYSGAYILVARVGANAGLMTKATGAFGVTDNTLIIVLNAKQNIDFIFYYLDQLGLNKMIFGSGQPLITGGQLKALIIRLPKEREQQRIASCLSSLDALITFEIQKLEALKTHKKGLMQQLFPSPEAAQAR